MILTCPNCSTRYQTDAAKFLPDGRKVRCVKCGHTWHQSPPGAVEAAAPEVVTAPEAVAAVAADVAPQVSPIPERTVVAEKPAGGGWRMGALTGWAALLGVAVVLAWAAVHFRQEVVSVWPQTATFYAKAGMEVNTVGLAFQNVSYRVTSEDDQPILHIRGKIVNITKRELPVPQIHAMLTDEQRRDLYDWKITVKAKTLGPGKDAEFMARIPSPPSGARHVDLRFVKGGV